MPTSNKEKDFTLWYREAEPQLLKTTAEKPKKRRVRDAPFSMRPSKALAEQLAKRGRPGPTVRRDITRYYTALEEESKVVRKVFDEEAFEYLTYIVNKSPLDSNQIPQFFDLLLDTVDREGTIAADFTVNKDSVRDVLNAMHYTSRLALLDLIEQRLLDESDEDEDEDE